VFPWVHAYRDWGLTKLRRFRAPLHWRELAECGFVASMSWDSRICRFRALRLNLRQRWLIRFTRDDDDGYRARLGSQIGQPVGILSSFPLGWILDLIYDVGEQPLSFSRRLLFGLG